MCPHPTIMAIAASVVATSIAFAQSSANPRKTVELKIVKLTEFEQVLAAQRGKVVVVYLWGDYSIPDKRTLKEVAQMRNRLSTDRVVFMTACHAPGIADDPKEREQRRSETQEALTKSKAYFKNFIVDEDEEVWASKLSFVSGPTFNIYDRGGKKIRTFSVLDGDYEVKDVERLVRKLAAVGNED